MRLYRVLKPEQLAPIWSNYDAQKLHVHISRDDVCFRNDFGPKCG